MGNQLLIYSGGSYRNYKDPDLVKEAIAQERGKYKFYRKSSLSIHTILFYYVLTLLLLLLMLLHVFYYVPYCFVYLCNVLYYL